MSGKEHIIWEALGFINCVQTTDEHLRNADKRENRQKLHAKKYFRIWQTLFPQRVFFFPQALQGIRLINMCVPWG